jgi:hypothetical protein
MKVEHIKDMPKLKKEIVVFLFDHVTKRPRNIWHKFECELSYEGKQYNLECDCRWDNEMFSYRDMHISHKQIVIDVHDMEAKGLLD